MSWSLMSSVMRSVPVVAFLLCAATSASAQTPPPVTTAPQPSTVTGTTSTPAAGFAELIGGFEADTHGAGYGFLGVGVVRPIRTDLAWVARGTVNFLAYEFDSLDGQTTVRSPGIGAAAGLQFGGKNFVRVLVGPEIKWRRTEITPMNGSSFSDTDVRVGANLGAEVIVNPTSHSNLMGLVNYGTADKYTWGRLGFKQQVTNRDWQGSNTWFLGVEAIGQGNEDIRSAQFGGFVEVTHVPRTLSIQLRAGYKRSTFDVGPAQTGPYVAVGFYKRLN